METCQQGPSEILRNRLSECRRKIFRQQFPSENIQIAIFIENKSSKFVAVRRSAFRRRFHRYTVRNLSVSRSSEISERTQSSEIRQVFSTDFQWMHFSVAVVLTVFFNCNTIGNWPFRRDSEGFDSRK